MAALFWFALLFLAYTFVGYFLLLGVVSLFRKRSHRRGTIWPSVSLIIPAHNEAALIESKIKNSLELLYPREKLEIIVASDGSEDGTPGIVRSFADRGVKLVEIPERCGKHYAQMVACDASQGEILVFTDASIHLEPDALQMMVSNFVDPSVGCVSSEDQVIAKKKGWTGEKSYVQFEMWLRRLETRVGSLVGVSGSFFAARREVCRLWHPEQSSDFFIALHTVARGMRVVVDPECRGHLLLVRSEKAELRRKVRTIVHGLVVFFKHLGLLNPIRYGVFSWQLITHKLFRWVTPFALLAVLVSNLFLWDEGLFYQLFLILQAGLYGFGLIALAIQGLSRFKSFKLVRFFLLGNAATVMAWLLFLSGEKLAAWEPSRRA